MKHTKCEVILVMDNNIHVPLELTTNDYIIEHPVRMKNIMFRRGNFLFIWNWKLLNRSAKKRCFVASLRSSNNLVILFERVQFVFVFFGRILYYTNIKFIKTIRLHWIDLSKSFCTQLRTRKSSCRNQEAYHPQRNLSHVRGGGGAVLIGGGGGGGTQNWQEDGGTPILVGVGVPCPRLGGGDSYPGWGCLGWRVTLSWWGRGSPLLLVRT